jgi:hypothetical protein
MGRADAGDHAGQLRVRQVRHDLVGPGDGRAVVHFGVPDDDAGVPEDGSADASASDASANDGPNIDAATSDAP